MTYGEMNKRANRIINILGFGGMFLFVICAYGIFTFFPDTFYFQDPIGFGALVLTVGMVFGAVSSWWVVFVYERRVDNVLVPVREMWEKQFDDLFFLLSHSGLHPTHWETVRLLWTGPASSTPKTSSPVTMPLIDQLLFEAYASDRDSFDRRLLETIGAGVIDARDGKFFISQRVFEAARQAYPLDDFPVPEPPKLSALNIGLSE